jgi:hypothetical protein
MAKSLEVPNKGYINGGTKLPSVSKKTGISVQFRTSVAAMLNNMQDEARSNRKKQINLLHLHNPISGGR